MSVCCVSAGTTEWSTPESPPSVNIAMNPSENSIDVVNLIEPRHTVPSQLKIFTPVGIAMSIVDSANAEMATGPRPVATTAYPNSGLRENTGSVSETMPMPGKIRMYTSGWPNSQKRC